MEIQMKIAQTNQIVDFQPLEEAEPPNASLSFDFPWSAKTEIHGTIGSLMIEHQERMHTNFRELLAQQEHLVHTSTQLLQQRLEQLLANESGLFRQCHTGSMSQCPNGASSSSLHAATAETLDSSVANEFESQDMEPYSGVHPVDNDQKMDAEHRASLFESQLWNGMFIKAQSKAFKPAACASTIISKSASKKQRQQMKWATRFVKSTLFEGIVALSILANSFFIGIEAQSTNTRNGTQHSMNIVFSIVVSLELMVRVYVEPFGFISRDTLCNFCDLATVLASWIELSINWIMTNNGQSFPVSLLRILRLLKLLRVARVLRIEVFREMRLMTHSLVHCLKPLTWTVLLLLAVVYVFAIVFTQAIHDTNHQNVYYQELQQYFSTTTRSMATLVSAVLGGKDWIDYSKPLSSISWVYELVFFAYIMFTQLALLNVVTGVFVDSSLNNAQHDRQIAIQDEMIREGLHRKELLELFEEADTLGIGEVPSTVLEEYLQDKRVKTYLKVLNIVYDDPKDLLNCLDSHNSDMIDAETFVKGCMALTSKQVVDLCTAIQENRRVCRSIEEMIAGIQKKIDSHSFVSSFSTRWRRSINQHDSSSDQIVMSTLRSM